MKKVLLIIVILLLAVLIIPLIIALFVPKYYSVEKSVTINQPKDQVWDYVILLKNQHNYSVWSKIDPNMKTMFRGTDGTVGFVSAWDSENPDAGKGEQEIKAIIEGARIDYEIGFIKPFESTAQAYMITEMVSEDETLVKLGFSGRMAYPTNLMLLVMDFKGRIGNDLQTGLNNLKQILEIE